MLDCTALGLIMFFLGLRPWKYIIALGQYKSHTLQKSWYNYYMYSASYHSALVQVLLPAYIIAPVKIHAELEIGACTTLVWGGPSMVSDGPSLIETCDFCAAMKLSSTIQGLCCIIRHEVLHALSSFP